MNIEKKPKFVFALSRIVSYIATDKPSAAKKFENKLNSKIKQIPNFPYKYRTSIYFQDDRYRDLVYKGYTIIYKIQQETIIILDIFKWNLPSE
jgi:plasmid stabilization system protein ParE